MSMIDADKLIEDIRKRNYISKALSEIFETIIDEQPTAFDVDEVIKRLKKLRDCKYLTGITNNAYEFGACDALNDAIKIIKAGGNS